HPARRLSWGLKEARGHDRPGGHGPGPRGPRRAAGLLPADGPDPRLRAARGRDVHPRQDRRLLPPQPGRGSHRGGPDRRPPGGGLPVRHLPGARVRAGPRRRTRPGDGRTVRPHRRAVARPGRLDAPVRHRAPAAGRVRDRRRPDPAGDRRGVRARLQGRPRAGRARRDVPAGDATTNIGAFHESLNLAALWQLPITYVIVNNQLGMGTPVEAASAEPELWRRGCAYRMPGQRVDGNDVLAVRDAARAAMAKARDEHQPTLLETVSYRLRGHSVVDPARYRTAEDTERLRREDPLPAFRGRLIASGVLDEEAAAHIDAEADKAVTAAVDFAA